LGGPLLQRLEGAEEAALELAVVAQHGAEAGGVPDRGRVRVVAVGEVRVRAPLAGLDRLDLQPLGALAAPHRRGEAPDEEVADLVPGREPLGEAVAQAGEGLGILAAQDGVALGGGGEAVGEGVHGGAGLALVRHGAAGAGAVAAGGLDLGGGAGGGHGGTREADVPDTYA
jgi:hypothetical protein